MDSSILKLVFHNERTQNKVWVSGLYNNELKILSGLAGLVKNIPSEFICSTSDNHPVTTIVETVPNIDMIYQLFHSINNNNPNYINYNNPNYISHYNSSGYTGDTGGTDLTSMTTNSGNTGPSAIASENSLAFNIYRVDLIPVVNKLITNERIICSISQEEIVEGDLYMCCNNCSNNFNKETILRWLMQKHQSMRTCPTCREIWANYDVYCNSE